VLGGLFIPRPDLLAQDEADRGRLPAGWHAATDWSARNGSAPPLVNARFVAAGDGYRATLGPAAIFWRETDTVRGDYRLAVALTQLKNPEHPESYGVFVGGRDLLDEGQAYTYFLVRAYDGRFSIRRRSGRRARPTVVVDWTAHESVTRADPTTGRATNELAVVVESGRVTFTINGTAVHAGAAGDIGTDGIVGYRVNHRLDVQLGPLRIDPRGAR
jgi:hypothetical protein